MGNILWYSDQSVAAEGESDEEVECDSHTENLVGDAQDLFAHYISFAKIDHWSIIEWYRTRTQTMHLDPVVVVPTPEGYHLVNKEGCIVHTLDIDQVLEFEDTMYAESVLDEGWQEVVARASKSSACVRGGH